MFNKRIKAQCGEAVSVVTMSGSRAIWLDMHLRQPATGDMPFVALSPKGAKQLRKALKRAIKANRG